MIIGIIGSRRRNDISDKILIEKELVKILSDCKNIVICSGGCSKGGDKFAEELSDKYNIPIIIYKAEWNKYGKSAGFKRNGKIAKKSDLLIACVSNDRTGGAEDTIKKFKKYHPFINDNNIILV